jgi:hypothetical protein
VRGRLALIREQQYQLADNPHARIAALERRVAALVALERSEAVRRKPLAEQAFANHIAGEQLYAEVRAIYDQHDGLSRLTAKQVLPKITREPKPSVRHVQDLLKRARAESSASR